MLPKVILISVILTAAGSSVALLLTTFFAIPSEEPFLRVILGSLIAAAEAAFLVACKRYSAKPTRVVLSDMLLSVAFVLITTVGLSRWVEYSLARSTAASDFAQDYLAAYALRHGIELYGPPFRLLATTFLQLENYDNFHTPFSALFFWPVSFLAYPTAFIFWNFLSLLLLVGVVVLLLRAYDLLTFRWLRLSSVLLLWEPFTSSIFLGQVSIVLSAGVIVSFFLLQAKRDTLAGVLLGLATLIKLYPGLFVLYLVSQRRWRGLRALVGTLFGGLFLMVLTVGVDTLLFYVEVVIPEHLRIYASYPLNNSMASGIKTIFEPTLFSQPLIFAPEIGWIVAIVINGLLIFIAGTISYLHNHEQSADDIFSLFCIVMLLASPMTWYHSCILLLLPLARLTREMVHEVRTARLRLLLVLILCGVPNQDLIDGFLAFTATKQVPWYFILGVRTGLFGLVLLYWSFWRRLASQAGYTSVVDLFRSLRLHVHQRQAFQ